MSSKNSDGIVIFSTEGNIMFSSTGEITSAKKAPRKHRIHKNITNKVFEDMRKFNKEEFWDNILIKFSRNVFHNDFRFINNILHYKFKSKNHKDQILIDEEDLEKTFENLKNFLRNKGILPVSEVVNNNSDLIGEREKFTNWKEAGKNQINLLYEFIIDLTDKLNLNSIESKHLESLLKLSIYNNIITSDHIILEDEKIKNIKHLLWDQEDRKFSLDIDKIKVKAIKQDKKNEEKFYTINSFSDDKHIIINKEVEIDSLEKKWEDFLDSYYIM